MSIRVESEPLGNNGQVRLSVFDGKSPLFADKLDPGVADERQGFLRKLMERCPDLVAEEVEEAILQMGSGGFPEARPQRPERPRREPPPEKPEEPHVARFIVSDIKPSKPWPKSSQPTPGASWRRVTSWLRGLGLSTPTVRAGGATFQSGCRSIVLKVC